MDTRTFLKRILYTKAEIDDWLSGKTHKMEKYDPELGWVLNTCCARDGVDASISTYTFDESGARRIVRHAERPCRVNTYGDSFTQCHQVSDGETWQEVLAAHLGEPIRNYGIGGQSVYQAYRRMLKQEPVTPAQYVILNVFEDDHFRNLPPWRRIRSPVAGRGSFLSPTLPHVDVNPATGKFVEHPNICPTPDSLYRLCELDWVCEQFKDDFTTQLMVARLNLQEDTPQLSYEPIRRLVHEHGIKLAVTDAASLERALDKLQINAALYATQRIVEKALEFARANQKKLLIALTFGPVTLADCSRGVARYDQPFVDFLKGKGVPFVDALTAHLDDFAKLKIDVEEYTKRYYVGHYSPAGNAFFAFAIKDQLVAMLDPKPPAYRFDALSARSHEAYDYGLVWKSS